MEQSGEEAERVARAFLAALDEGRWSDAAHLVDVRTRDAFQAWCLEAIRAAADAPPSTALSDTQFPSVAELMGVSTAEEASQFTSTEFLARFAQALTPESLGRHRGARAFEGQSRITRSVTDADAGVHGRATVRYRTECWEDGERNLAVGGIHSLELVHTGQGWRVRDAGLSGFGSGHILPPGEP